MSTMNRTGHALFMPMHTQDYGDAIKLLDRSNIDQEVSLRLCNRSS